MTDEKVGALLRSHEPMVVIEAPAGCGKTYQAAWYAADIAKDIGLTKVLILTHTHAACSVIAKRTQAIRQRIELRTLDGFVHEIASVYHKALSLPADVAVWARTTQDGFEVLAKKVSTLLQSSPMITKMLAKRYPVIICDEHQDSNVDQEAIVLSIAKQGAKVRVFGDPMQVIPGGHGQDEKVAEVRSRWNTLKATGAYEELRTGHRWSTTDPGLGEWILASRQNLFAGRPVDLTGTLPEGITILVAENRSMNGQFYRFCPDDENWGPVNRAINSSRSMLCLAARAQTVDGLRSTFKARLPIWEGHSNKSLEKLVDTLGSADVDQIAKAKAYLKFLKATMSGFTSEYSRRMLTALGNPARAPRGQTAVTIAAMAKMISDGNRHRGYCGATELLKGLIKSQTLPFQKMRIDYPRELNDFLKLGEFDDPHAGLAEIVHRRSRAHPSPPDKCLSTAHKSKGLEAETVVLFAADGEHFTDSLAKRNLLYVALSRATSAIYVVVSKSNPSPLLLVE
ncbi:UNVERIFIED_ORG: DNA helicase-2/ATP-dependent DNA helicase PcrA [Ensifer adhaerens]|nr:DNA helicase-2/ATP-dependent DNA helicase PcrA [Ensifer adhaerens]